jgi:hypothetical protein
LLNLNAAEALIAVDSQSHALNGLGELPVVDLAASVGLAPDFVVVPRLLDSDQSVAERLQAQGSDVIEFDPHDFEEAYSLFLMLGSRLGRAKETRAYVRDHSRELALMSASSSGHQRPRVVAVLSWAPLEVAGGHSFTTDLIEIAGAESVTHDNEDSRIPMTRAELVRAAPDLVLITTPDPVPESERRVVRTLLGEDFEIAFLAFEPQSFWLRAGIETARQVRALVEPLAQRLPPDTNSTGRPGSDDLRAIPNPMARPIPDIAVKNVLESLISR